jgi:hypothetical protein
LPGFARAVYGQVLAVLRSHHPTETDVSLRDMIRQGEGLDAIAAYLDGLSHDERIAETRSLGRADQRQLYQSAEKAAPIDLAHFVAPSEPMRTSVRHHGKNTLPLPGSLRYFEKRFAKPEDGGDRLFGYNESPFLGTIGPGFFVAVPTAGNAAWETRGAIVIDYFQHPDGPVPDEWPPVVPNTKGLQKHVYHRTRDFMRKVSTHVSIGAAYKEETALDHYFVLCRQA